MQRYNLFKAKLQLGRNITKNIYFLSHLADEATGYGAHLTFAPYIIDKDHFHLDDLISAAMVRRFR